MSGNDGNEVGAGGGGVDGTQTPNVEEIFSRVMALLPLVQETEPLEQIGTLLDLDIASAGGDQRALKRLINIHIDSPTFDAHAERTRFLTSALETLQATLNLRNSEVETTENATETGPGEVFAVWGGFKNRLFC